MSVVQEQLSTSLAGRYRIERELGAGGMATVYLARDLRHDRQVALKVMNADVVAAVGGERFVQEIRTTAKLKHPHILPLFDSGAAADTLFYVMPYIDGESLRGAHPRDPVRCRLGEALQILREVADALAHAHAQGVDPSRHQARQCPALRISTRSSRTSALPAHSRGPRRSIGR